MKTRSGCQSKPQSSYSVTSCRPHSDVIPFFHPQGPGKPGRLLALPMMRSIQDLCRGYKVQSPPILTELPQQGSLVSTCSLIHREFIGQDAPDLAEGRQLEAIFS